MKIKKTVAKVFALILTLAMATGVAFGYTDVPAGSDLEKNVSALTTAGFVNGYGDDTFRPEGDITRAELVKMINKVMGYTGSSVSNTFKDVAEADWFYGEVMVALQKGYLLGYTDGTFRPDNNITRQEVAVIIDRIEKLDARLKAEDVAKVNVTGAAAWAADSVKRCIAAGLMTADADGNFRGAEKATRAVVAAASIAILKYDGRITTDASGNMTVDKVADTPAVTPEGGGSGGGGGGGGGSSDAKTPATGTVKTDIEVLSSQLAALISSSEYTSAEKSILTKIKSSIESYYKDTSYDVNSAINDTKKLYSAMSDTEKNAFETKLKSSGLDIDAINNLEKEFNIDII